ncbi:hypothetical protein F0562_005498 [Nyssa sinensis]|uniref:Uncharacterized protein n=1 Tax=Nyssa sinensis TaxID=561372 RepID=A0A5J5AKU6_9ASTE|nr:hypothetical protein F0562_005498 [Nyssa sinensis]
MMILRRLWILDEDFCDGETRGLRAGKQVKENYNDANYESDGGEACRNPQAASVAASTLFVKRIAVSESSTGKGGG